MARPAQPTSPSQGNAGAGGGQPPMTQDPKVKTLIQDCIEAVRKDVARLDRDKQDWLNVLGYHGGPDNWWVTWDGADNMWRRIPDDNSDYGLPEEVPRCASNMYRRKIDGIAAILNQSAPAQEWRPAKDEPKARATAEVIEDALPVLRDECGYDAHRNLINLNVTLTDKVGYEVYYDTDEKYGMQQIDALQCQECGWSGMPMDVDDAAEGQEPQVDDETGEEQEPGCPNCQAPADALGPLISPLGIPIGVKYPKGKLCGVLYTTHELSLPPNARECHEQHVPYIVTHRLMGREDACRLWKEKAQFIRRAKAETSAANTSSQYATAVRNISSPRAAARGVMPLTTDSVLVWRVVHDPIDDPDAGYSFPDGLDAVMIDGEVIDAGPLPLKDDSGQPMKPIVLRQYVQAPGSPFGIPPADDLGVLQRQRNLIETLLLLILLHDASPRTWIPLTVQLEDPITGLPGQQIRYRSNVPGERPHTDPGINPPEGLYKALEMNDEMFDKISGLNAVLEGQRPQGDPTLGEVQTLRETGMATFKTPLDQLIDFENRLSYLLLQWARQSMWTERLIRSRGDNGEWDIKAFTGADLSGSVDVYVNPASAWPKSALLQQLRLKDAIQMGIVNPQDPEIQEKVLSDYDLAHYKPSIDADRKQIGRELERWKAATGPGDIQPPGNYDNLPMHIHYKSQFMKSEEAEAIRNVNPPLWAAMDQHIGVLKMMAAPPPQAGPPGGGPPGAPPAGPAGKPGPPDGSALEHEIQKGNLKPAEGPPHSPLDHMVASGHLTPAPPAAGLPGGPPKPGAPGAPAAPGGPPAGPGAPPAAGPTGPSVDELQQQHRVDDAAEGHGQGPQG
jgi:hypothetical protein